MEDGRGGELALSILQIYAGLFAGVLPVVTVAQFHGTTGTDDIGGLYFENGWDGGGCSVDG